MHTPMHSEDVKCANCGKEYDSLFAHICKVKKNSPMGKRLAKMKPGCYAYLKKEGAAVRTKRLNGREKG